MIRFRFIIITLILSLLLFQGIQAQPPEQESTLVEVGKIEKKSLETTISLNGSVKPRFETTIGAEIAGRAERLLVEEGDTVRKKETLALIDPDRYQALFNAAEARMKKTSQDLTRGRSLFEEGFLSREELDQRLVDDDTARAEWEIARLDLKNAGITAPFDGVITHRHVDPGAWLDRGDPIFEISDLSMVHVMTPVPERHIQDVSVGQTALLTVSSAPDRTFKGNVRAVIPKADAGRNYPVKIEVPNPDGLLKNGMFARVDLTLKNPTDVLMVSKDAVVHYEKGDLLFVIRNGKAEKVPVQTGRESGSLIEVRGALQAGDRVAVTGNENLHDGDTVKIVNPPPDRQ